MSSHSEIDSKSSNSENSDLDYIKFFVYDYDEDDPRYGVWYVEGDKGVSLFEYTPEGQGMWLNVDLKGSTYEPIIPSEQFKRVASSLMDESGVLAKAIEDLPPYEREFMFNIIGSLNETPNIVPVPIMKFIAECSIEYPDGVDESDYDTDSVDSE